MKAEDYFPLKDCDQISLRWIRSLDRKRQWETGLGNTALLVLDMQRFFTDPLSSGYLPSSRTIIERIKRLMGIYEGPVFFTRHRNDPRDIENLMSVWWRGTIKGEIGEIDPSFNTGELPVIDKSHYSALEGTVLRESLKSISVDTVIISGVMTDLCCETTARDAFMKGFKIVFLADCTATETEERHLSTLRIISRAFGEVLTSKELMSRL
jgi:nicotinamidase-related amidase